MRFNLIVILFLFISNMGIAQPSINELPTDQYEQIRIKGVLFVDIKNTYGNILEMEKLLGKAEVSVSGKEIGEETREFKYENGLQISFGDFDLKNDKPELFYLKTNNIFIKNVNLSIGNSIEKLGKDIIFNKDKDGSFSIMFTHMNGDCCPMIIEFDQQTKKIISIEYFVWT